MCRNNDSRYWYYFLQKDPCPGCKESGRDGHRKVPNISPLEMTHTSDEK